MDSTGNFYEIVKMIFLNVACFLPVHITRRLDNFMYVTLPNISGSWVDAILAASHLYNSSTFGQQEKVSNGLYHSTMASVQASQQASQFLYKIKPLYTYQLV